jgi:hypothetical protein
MINLVVLNQTKNHHTMNTRDEIINIFCLVDDFCKEYTATIEAHSITNETKKRNRPCRLSSSEVIAIMINFHHKGYRCFKHYYLEHVCRHLTDLFPKLVSYNRFTELMQENAMAIGGVSQTLLPG